MENLFNLTKKRLSEEALTNKILFENIPQFTERVKRTLEAVASQYADATIESMPKRCKEVALFLLGCASFLVIVCQLKNKCSAEKTQVVALHGAHSHY